MQPPLDELHAGRRELPLFAAPWNWLGGAIMERFRGAMTGSPPSCQFAIHYMFERRLPRPLRHERRVRHAPRGHFIGTTFDGEGGS
jgi:hypothetical protein